MYVNKKVMARMLMAALQVKAGNQNKAYRLLASVDAEELEQTADEVVDVVEAMEEDPFMNGEDAEEVEATAEDFDLSEEDYEEASDDEDDEAEDDDDYEPEDEDEEGDEDDDEGGSETASIRSQRNRNIRLMQLASLGRQSRSRRR